MPDLVKITPEIFPKLYKAFLHDDDPLSDERAWRNVFNYQWPTDEDHQGYALIDKGDVVGMMAMAFSRRVVDGRPRKFCNIHTWWVREDQRGHSVAMLRPLLALKDHTITHFTPCNRIRALTKRLGFVDLNLQMRVLTPLTFHTQISRRPNLPITITDEIDREILDGTDLRIFLDHRPYRAGNLMITNGGDYCYVLYTLVERYRFRYCHIHYIGNKTLFADHEPAIRAALMGEHGVRFVVLDARLVQDITFKGSFRFWAPAHAVYRPVGDITENKVDNLYSDVVMLRLAVLPHIRHEFSEMVRRLVPFTQADNAA